MFRTDSLVEYLMGCNSWRHLPYIRLRDGSRRTPCTSVQIKYVVGYAVHDRLETGDSCNMHACLYQLYIHAISEIRRSFIVRELSRYWKCLLPITVTGLQINMSPSPQQNEFIAPLIFYKYRSIFPVLFHSLIQQALKLRKFSKQQLNIYIDVCLILIQN
jgi:hypothetical protein